MIILYFGDFVVLSFYLEHSKLQTNRSHCSFCLHILKAEKKRRENYKNREITSKIIKTEGQVVTIYIMDHELHYIHMKLHYIEYDHIKSHFVYQMTFN